MYYPTSTPSSEASITITKSDVYTFCSCDLVQDICDPLCCCDSECSSQESLWTTTFNWNCINAVNSATNFCYQKQPIYKINEKRGLEKTTSNDSDLVCVKGSGNFIDKNYQAVKTLTALEQTSLSDTIP